MALPSTIYSFDIDLADVDRGVYESLALKVARHPSETEDYLITRVLAYCLEHIAGLAFSRGLAEPNEPALSVRDLTGALQAYSARSETTGSTRVAARAGAQHASAVMPANSRAVKP